MLPQFKNNEPLFLIILREDDARNKFSRWVTTSKSIQAKIEDNRMYLYDFISFNLFLVNWKHSWDNILVWDTLAKRHIFW